ncbi:MAG: phosphohistidine phosphatase [Actinobacteria bacterium HGW-Actinobacteria-4]|nr:MAG: phosphohistidine phosphatase [Actinobacteria bacterium HGW-Actinobacteria-4]
MPTLVLVRHAKAERPVADQPDHDRALTLAGRASATQLGERLARAGVNPDYAIVSSALRTQQTWQLMAAAFGEAEVVTSRDVYDTDDEGLHELIREVPDSVETLVVVGHEPTISATTAALAAQGSDTRALQRVAHGFPTGTAAVLELEGAWADLELRGAQLNAMLSADVQY